MNRAAIIGTGLVGASIGLALKSNEWTVTGWDPEPESLTTAANRGALDPSPDMVSAVSGADIVFLAGPLGANLELLNTIDTAALVTDVTSVKTPLVDAAPSHLRFVGGHPMAGREQAGPTASSAGLFRGAAWVLCDDNTTESDLGLMSDLVSLIGANPIVMSAVEHDAAVAQISHVPHLLAVALTNLVASNPSASGLISGSFRDLTRVAAGEASWWPEILTANHGPVLNSLHDLLQGIDDLKKGIADGDQDSIRKAFESARASRSVMTPSLARVRVVLHDRPGEIARVGHALQKSQVDVRDLQLRHAEHGGGGILTINVRQEEVTPLTASLAEEGFLTE